MDALAMLAAVVIKHNPMTVMGDPRPRPATITDAEAAELFYPEPARAKGLEGYAVVMCKVDASDLTPHACRVVAEKPRREGFGDKAKLVAAKIKVREIQFKQAQTNGKRDEIDVWVPVVFQMRPPAPEAGAAETGADSAAP